MRIGALVLAMVLWVPQGEASLGDFGTIAYPDTPPNVARIEATIRFVFSLFPDVEIPPTKITILPLAEYEERIAQMEAGPNWQMWLRQYRAQSEWTLSASTSRVSSYREGELRIMTPGELPDMILIHEVIHFVLSRLEPSFEDSILNTEAIVRNVTAEVMTSQRYRAYLRQRPWVQ